MLFDFAKKIFNNKRKILIINEGDRYGINLRDGLQKINLDIASMENNDDLLQAIIRYAPDLILILISNSQEDGMAILEKLKNNKILIPTMLCLDSQQFSIDVELTKKYGIVDTITFEEINSSAAIAKISAYLNINIFGNSKDTAYKLKVLEPKENRKNIIILLVEDYKDLRETLGAKLARNGYTVHLAKDGEEALMSVNSLQPQLILLDIIMPGMSGFEVLKKIKKDEKTKNIPVIMLSNLGEEDDIQKARILGAVDYLVKANVDMDYISNKLAFYLKLL
jgi:CheY-like chemotaxis protein